VAVDDQIGVGGTEPGDSPAGRLARAVSAKHVALLGTLRDELGDAGHAEFADAASRLASEFGSVTATAVDAAYAGAPSGGRPPWAPQEELPSLYRPGHMRRRLDQLIETNRRYDHPFAIAIFDASGPGAREDDGSRETVLAILGAALRDSIRIIDEAFRLEEDAICVLAPNIGTVEGVQMAERLLGQLEELEKAGGLRIDVAAGVVGCPEHGNEPDALLHKADAALWRARAVGQPIGVGGLQDR
jgi:diguanylate cyclase (GGDEF)-like protein